MAQWKHWQSKRHGGASGSGGLHAVCASGPYTLAEHADSQLWK